MIKRLGGRIMRLNRFLCAAVVAGATIGSSGVVQAAAPEDMPPVFAQTNVGTKLESGSSLSVQCPENSVILSGGFLSDETDAYGVTASKPSGNGWSITVQDTGQLRSRQRQDHRVGYLRLDRVLHRGNVGAVGAGARLRPDHGRDHRVANRGVSTRTRPGWRWVRYRKPRRHLDSYTAVDHGRGRLGLVR